MYSKMLTIFLNISNKNMVLHSKVFLTYASKFIIKSCENVLNNKKNFIMK